MQFLWFYGGVSSNKADISENGPAIVAEGKSIQPDGDLSGGLSL